VLLNATRNDRDLRAANDCVCLRMIRRHEYEDQLLQARRLAEESSAAKAKFLSMMSHDLRTPLTTIYGNAQLLAAEAERLARDQLRAMQAADDTDDRHPRVRARRIGTDPDPDGAGVRRPCRRSGARGHAARGAGGMAALAGISGGMAAALRQLA